MVTHSQAGRPLRFSTALGDDALLLEKVEGAEELSQLYSYRLQLLARRPVVFDDVMAQPATVTIRPPNRPSRTINGIISRLTQGGRVPGPDGKSTFIRYQAELVPSLWLLGRRLNSRLFQRQSTLDIVRSLLADEWGLKVAVRVHATYEPRTMVVQYHETDLAFISRLLEDDGLSYFFEHEADKHTLVITDVLTGRMPRSVLGTMLFEEVEGGNRDEARVQSWEKTQEIQSALHTLTDYHFQKPDDPLEQRQSVLEKVAVGAVSHRVRYQLTVKAKPLLEVYEYPGGYARRFDGIDKDGNDAPLELPRLYNENRRLVGVRAEESAARSLLVRGASDAAAFQPGVAFDLAGHFDGNGRYLLTRIEHLASHVGAYTSTSGVDVPFVYQNHFECLPGDLPYRPERRTVAPKIDGTETAVVVGVSDSDPFTDKYGRVKVRFAWDREAHAKGDSSFWVRVAQPWAGQAYGSFALPRPGQEVVLAFRGGNPDEPVVVGSVYNDKNPPPYTLPDNRAVTGYKTRSKGGKKRDFNGLLFDDTPGKEETMLRSQRDLLLYASDHTVMQSGGNLDIYVGGHVMEHLGKFPTPSLGSGSGGGADLPSRANQQSTEMKKKVADAEKAYNRKLTPEEETLFKGSPLTSDEQLANEDRRVAEKERLLGRPLTPDEEKKERGYTTKDLSPAQKKASFDRAVADAKLKNGGTDLTQAQLDQLKTLNPSTPDDLVAQKEAALKRPLTPDEEAAIRGTPLTPAQLEANQDRRVTAQEQQQNRTLTPAEEATLRGAPLTPAQTASNMDRQVASKEKANNRPLTPAEEEAVRGVALTATQLLANQERRVADFTGSLGKPRTVAEEETLRGRPLTPAERKANEDRRVKFRELDQKKPLTAAEEAAERGQALSPNEYTDNLKRNADFLKAKGGAIDFGNYQNDPERLKFEQWQADLKDYRSRLAADQAYEANSRLAWKDYSNDDNTVSFAINRPTLKMTCGLNAKTDVGLNYGVSIGGGVSVSVNPFSFLGEIYKMPLEGIKSVIPHSAASLLGGSIGISLGGGGTKFSIGPSYSWSRGNTVKLEGSYPGGSTLSKVVESKAHDVAAAILATAVTATTVLTQALIGHRNKAIDIGLIATNAAVGLAVGVFVGVESSLSLAALKRAEAHKTKMKKVAKDQLGGTDIGALWDDAATLLTDATQKAKDAIKEAEDPSGPGKDKSNAGSLTFVETSATTFAQSFLWTAIAPSSGTDGSLILLNAEGNDGLKNGSVLVRGSEFAQLHGGDKGVAVTTDKNSDGDMSLLCGKGVLALGRLNGKDKDEAGTDKTQAIIMSDDMLYVLAPTGDMTLEAKDVKIKKAKTITLEATDSITLKVGASTSLTLNKTSVELKSRKFTASLDTDLLLKALTVAIEARTDLKTKGKWNHSL